MCLTHHTTILPFFRSPGRKDPSVRRLCGGCPAHTVFACAVLALRTRPLNAQCGSMSQTDLAFPTGLQPLAAVSLLACSPHCLLIRCCTDCQAGCAMQLTITHTYMTCACRLRRLSCSFLVMYRSACARNCCFR